MTTLDDLDLTWIAPYYLERQTTFVDMVNSADLDNGWDIAAYKSDTVDTILTGFFNELHAGEVQLIAAGGYGRREMDEGSDVDIHLIVDRIDDENSSRLAAYTQLFEQLFARYDFLDGTALINGYDDFPGFDDTQFSRFMDSRLLVGDEVKYQRVRTILSNEMDNLEMILRKLAELDRHRAKHPEPLLDYRTFHIKAGVGGLRDFQLGLTFSALQDFASLPSLYHTVPPEILEGVGYLHKLRSWQHLRGQSDNLHFADVQELTAQFGNEALIRLGDYRKAVNRFLNGRLSQLFEEGVQLGEGIYYSQNGLALAPGTICARNVLRMVEASQKYHLPIERTTTSAVQITRPNEGNTAFVNLFGQEGSLSDSLERLWDMEVMDSLVPGFRVAETVLYGEGHPREGRSKAYQAINRLRNLERLVEEPQFKDAYERLDRESLQGLRLALFLKGIPRLVDASVPEYLDAFQTIYPNLSTLTVSLAKFLIQEQDSLYHTAQEEDLSDIMTVSQFTSTVNKSSLDALLLFTGANLGYGVQDWFPDDQWTTVFNLYRQAVESLEGEVSKITASPNLDSIANTIFAAMPPELRMTRSTHILESYAKSLGQVAVYGEPIAKVQPLFGGKNSLVEVYAPDRRGLALNIFQVIYESGIGLYKAFLYSVEDPNLALDMFTVGDLRDPKAFKNHLLLHLDDPIHDAPLIRNPGAPVGLRKKGDSYRLSMTGRPSSGQIYSTVHLISQDLEGDIRSIKALSSRRGEVNQFYFFVSPYSEQEIRDVITGHGLDMKPVQ